MTVDVMHLVKVDVIRLQPLQTGLTVLANLVGGEAAGKKCSALARASFR